MSLFPIAAAEDYLRTVAPSLLRSGNTLRWPSDDGMGELSVSEVNARTRDGLVVSEIVTVTHASPRFAGLPPDVIAHLNSLATISALVPGSDSDPARLVAKVGIFSGDQAAAERVYAPLLCTEAVINGWHASRLVRGELECDPQRSPLRMTDRDPAFDDADFAAIKAITDGYRFLGTLGGTHFTVEFPWDPGALTRGLLDERFREHMRRSHGVSDEDLDRWSGLTSLLQISIADHPLYGRGVQSTLEIPVPSDDPARLANELNAWELSSPELPPHFGAWCIVPARSPIRASCRRSPASLVFCTISPTGWLYGTFASGNG